jgi:cathepsin F
MKVIYLVILSLILVNLKTSCQTVESIDLKAPTKDQFKIFYKVYNKEAQYNLNSEEGVRRYFIYKKNVKWIKEENEKAGKVIYGVTPFTDMTNEEFNQKHLIKKEAVEEIEKSLRENQTKINSTSKLNQNTDVDWRSKISTVKNVGRCDSFHSFSTVAAVEGNVNNLLNTQYNFSEQYLIDCDNVNSSCWSGTPNNSFDFMIKNGLVETSKKPYVARKDVCSSNDRNNALNVVTGFESCTNCTEEVWLDLLRRGPIVAMIDASSSNFQNYKPTSIDTPWLPESCSTPNLLVTVVGIKYSGTDAILIVRNALSNGWGFEGHFSVSLKNNCLLTKSAWLPKVQAPAPLPAPVCPEFFSSCTDPKTSLKECNGIVSSTNTLGTTIKGWTKVSDNWAFFKEENCVGDFITATQSRSCFSTRTVVNEYKSAAIIGSIPRGCVVIYTGPCSTGNKFQICYHVPDLGKIGITSIGTILFNAGESYAESLILFDNLGYTGSTVSFDKKQYFNLVSHEFNSFLPLAKSLIIRVR